MRRAGDRVNRIGCCREQRCTANYIRETLARVQHSTIYDAARDRVVMFGGLSLLSLQELNDTWEYDGETDQWTDVTVAAGVAPSPRQSR